MESAFNLRAAMLGQIYPLLYKNVMLPLKNSHGQPKTSASTIQNGPSYYPLTKIQICKSEEVSNKEDENLDSTQFFHSSQ